jgi:NADPH-dependent 2,4-dienoyl-CoA reductase/sulfur reductase-like enzyme
MPGSINKIKPWIERIGLIGSEEPAWRIQKEAIRYRNSEVRIQNQEARMIKTSNGSVGLCIVYSGF